MEFSALGGLPGAFVKFFLEKAGNVGLTKMLDGFEDRSATAVCAIAFTAGPGRDVFVFEGRAPGRIVQARGEKNFGWDPIFQPEDYELTYGEMDDVQKSTISHRYKAAERLKAFLTAL